MKIQPQLAIAPHPYDGLGKEQTIASIGEHLDTDPHTVLSGAAALERNLAVLQKADSHSTTHRVPS